MSWPLLTVVGFLVGVLVGYLLGRPTKRRCVCLTVEELRALYVAGWDLGAAWVPPVEVQWSIMDKVRAELGLPPVGPPIEPESGSR